MASRAADPPLVSLPSRWLLGSPLQGQEAGARRATGGGGAWPLWKRAKHTVGTARRGDRQAGSVATGGTGGSLGSDSEALPPSLPAPPRLTCNNLPDLVGGHRACGGVRAATAAPWPVSAALLTGHAWPAAGGPQTWGVGWPQAGLGGRGYLPDTERPLRQRGQGSGRDAAGEEVRSGDGLPRRGAGGLLTPQGPGEQVLPLRSPDPRGGGWGNTDGIHAPSSSGLVAQALLHRGPL